MPGVDVGRASFLSTTIPLLSPKHIPFVATVLPVKDNVTIRSARSTVPPGSAMLAPSQTVPDRSSATAAAASSLCMPTAGAASSFRTHDRTATVAAVSTSLCTASAAGSFRAGLVTVPTRFRAVVVAAMAAWVASCGKTTHVAGSCSWPRARRAAADGLAV